MKKIVCHKNELSGTSLKISITFFSEFLVIQKFSGGKFWWFRLFSGQKILCLEDLLSRCLVCLEVLCREVGCRETMMSGSILYLYSLDGPWKGQTQTVNENFAIVYPLLILFPKIFYTTLV